MARQEDIVHMYVPIIIVFNFSISRLIYEGIITVMNYISEGELFSLVDKYGCLPEKVVRIYVAEIALAIGKNNFKDFLSIMYKIRHIYTKTCVAYIDFLHNAGVVHRDLKTSNILLDEDGHAVIIDFGLAKWLHRTERTNTFCGTPQYMGKNIYKYINNHNMYSIYICTVIYAICLN